MSSARPSPGSATVPDCPPSTEPGDKCSPTHEHIKDICRRLAKLGYVAVAPELYARQGDVSKIKDIGEVFDHSLPRHPACLLRRLPPQLPQGSGSGRLEAAAGMVQDTRGVLSRRGDGAKIGPGQAPLEARRSRARAGSAPFLETVSGPIHGHGGNLSCSFPESPG